MNICVIGGGGTKGKFGRDFCDCARAQGHNVYVLSHKDYNQNDPRQLWADFKNIDNVVTRFTQLIESIDHIDIFIYNTTSDSGSFPHLDRHFKSTNKFDCVKGWHNTIDLHAVIPHMLCVTALNKMSATSKLVFMVSGLAMYFDRPEWNDAAGYSSGKAAQIFLMLGFSSYNDRGAISTAVSPHFDYTNPAHYEIIFNRVYDHILDMNQDQNGKIKSFYNIS
jgi:NAD(P)-dependent dehydrogenase (short-subunit alcohol dehydrogenase family)